MREIFRRICTTVGIILGLTIVAYIFDAIVIAGLQYWFKN